MIKLISASHYFQPVHDGTPLPSLDAALKDLCREQPRRIDRFIKLALLGSARCTGGRTLQSDCGIYIGSGLGPIGNNAVIQKQLIHDREMPKPFNFINTLGSAAGYQVAGNLGLRGQSLFISRRGASLQAVLNAAMADLMLGIVTQALVGLVEELTLPINEHRLRQSLSEDMEMAEGSDWMLLESDAVNGRELQVKHFTKLRELEDFLSSSWRAGDRLCCARGMEHQTVDSIRRRYDGIVLSDSDTAFHDSLESAWFIGNAAKNEPANLFLVDGGIDSSWGLFHLGT